uniref:Uncharacterized protein n=1 Tax=Nelumbo nucifera TaxID=4432 RepID=A0A822Z903_NELNU|nr:TPA_asm: hypothetical protein HUJ06_014152 [Nelumbo nucifera]
MVVDGAEKTAHAITLEAAPDPEAEDGAAESSSSASSPSGCSLASIIRP